MDLKEKLMWRLRTYTNIEYYKSKLSFYRECENLNRLTVLENVETIEYLIENQHSFIRWGCGESNHVLGNQNPTQEYDRNLSISLRKIVEKYNYNNNYLLGLPSIYIKKDKKSFQNQDKSIIGHFNSSRYLFNKYGKPDLVYGDAFVFRPERSLDTQTISELWNEKHTILISGNKIFGDYIKSETNPAEFTFVESPSKNSFRQINNLMDETLELTNRINNKKNIRVLVACGPAGKVIAHRLTKMNIITYDIGNFFQRVS